MKIVRISVTLDRKHSLIRKWLLLFYFYC